MIIDVNFDFTNDTPNFWDDFWIGDGDMSKNPMPQTVEEYLQWIKKQLEFVEKRNRRIAKSSIARK